MPIAMEAPIVILARTSLRLTGASLPGLDEGWLHYVPRKEAAVQKYLRCTERLRRLNLSSC